MIDMTPRELVLAVIVCNILVNVTGIAIIKLWVHTIRIIGAARFKRQTGVEETQLCLDPFHAHCDRPLGHPKHEPHECSTQLVMWK